MSPRSFKMFALARNLRARIDRDSGVVLTIRLGFVGLEFLSTLALARLFGASAYGSYAFAMAVVAILAVPASAGFDRMLIREVAAYRARQQWGLLHGLLRRATQVAFVVSTALALGAAALAYGLGARLPADVAPTLLLALIGIPIIALARVRLAGLQGVGHVAAGQLPEMLIQPTLLLALAVTTSLALGMAGSGTLIVGLYLLSAVLAGLVGVVLWVSRRPAAIRDASPIYRTSEWVAASAPFAAILAFAVTLTSLDTIAVGSHLGAAPAGIYRVASQMTMLVGVPLTAVNLVAAPRMAALHALGDLKAMRALAADCARQILVLALPIWIGLVALGKPILALFGTEFPSAYPVLLVLGTAHLAASFAGIAGYTLIMTGHERPTMAAFGAMVVSCVAGNALLVPRFGLEGAALATGLSLVGLAFWLSFLCRTRVGVNTILSRRSSIGDA